MIDVPSGRRLSRSETHDLAMIIKDRSKVLMAHAEEQAAACMADFERKLAAEYAWDGDEIWKSANEKAMEIVRATQEIVAERCQELGIPKTFAPHIGLTWQGRGENALATRRTELRRVAESAINAMKKAAITKIEKQACDLRAQVVSMALISEDARMFLDSLAPIEETMRSLDFHEVEARLESEHATRKRIFGY